MYGIYLSKLRSTIDVILGTGDLSDKGAREAYDRLEDYCASFSAPSFWLPGNHDDRAQMSAAAREPSRLSGEVRAGHWQILLLDSQIPGKVGGELGEGELARLELLVAECGIWAQGGTLTKRKKATLFNTAHRLPVGWRTPRC